MFKILHTHYYPANRKKNHPAKLYKQGTNRFPFAIRISDKKLQNTLRYVYRKVVLPLRPVLSLPPALVLSLCSVFPDVLFACGKRTFFCLYRLYDTQEAGEKRGETSC